MSQTYFTPQQDGIMTHTVSPAQRVRQSAPVQQLDCHYIIRLFYNYLQHSSCLILITACPLYHEM